MADSRSPEEKLLGLIRNNRSHRAQPAKGKEAAGAPSSGWGKGLSSSLIARLKTVKWDLPKVRAFLFVFACLYFLTALVYSVWGSKKVTLADPRVATAARRGGKADPDAKSLETYLEGIHGHRIFGQSAEDDSVPLPVNVFTGSDEEFVLIGVIFDADPQAIVEDKRAQQTSYLRKGQLWNGFHVQDVREGTLILERAGEVFELHM